MNAMENKYRLKVTVVPEMSVKEIGYWNLFNSLKLMILISKCKDDLSELNISVENNNPE